jgi:hypothetical protein
VAELGFRYRDLASKLDLVRGRGAFGRKPNRYVLNEISKDGIVQVFHESQSGEEITIESFQDVTPILEANAKDYLSGHDGYSPSRDWKKVASIPVIEVHRMLQNGINIFDRNDWPKVAAKLDDPEWSKFRTSPGRISRKPNREYFRASTGS